MCLVPSLIIFAIFFFYPLYRLVSSASTSTNRFGTAAATWASASTRDVLTGDQFLAGLRHSLTYVLLHGARRAGPRHAAGGRRPPPAPGIKVFQTIFSSTVATSVAVASVIFFVLLNPQVGYFSNVEFLSLADPDTALCGVSPCRRSGRTSGSRS